MTDNEIIKALECCKKGDCKNCTFDECTTGLLDQGIALSLINRQKAEIERLKGEKSCIIEHLKGTRRRLKTAKAEAIKEFAERLKREKRDLFCIENVDGLIDNLVKEMVGDDNDR